jgi:uroporphyrinogen decarboxylase
MASSILRFYEQFTPDVLSIIGDLWLEAEAVGNELDFPEEATCYVKRYVLEDKINLAKLNVPDPKHDKRLPDYLECFERIASVIKDTPVAGAVSGPCTIAMCLRRPETFITDTYDDPNFVHELMRYCTDLTKKFGDALKETGSSVNVGDPSASCTCISPAIYREFVKPYHQEVVDHFQQVALHICGYIDPLIEELIGVGFNAISIDETSSLRKIVLINQKRAVIFGNVSTHLFVDGTKKQIEESVKECIDIAAKGSAFILAPGCEVPPETPIENIDYFMEAARKYGSYERIMAL